VNGGYIVYGAHDKLQEERPFETPSLPLESETLSMSNGANSGNTLSSKESKELDYWLKGIVNEVM